VPASLPHQSTVRAAWPDLAVMTRDFDAGLLIGDPAFEADHVALGLEKVDLGLEWRTMTGSAVRVCAWTGRPGRVTGEDVRALQHAQREGLAAVDLIAAEYANGDSARTAKAATT
jgi:hypothetical protein